MANKDFFIVAIIILSPPLFFVFLHLGVDCQLSHPRLMSAATGRQHVLVTFRSMITYDEDGGTTLLLTHCCPAAYYAA